MRPLPGQKFLHGAGIGAARVRFVDVSREKFEEAHAGLAGGAISAGTTETLGNELV